MTAPGATAGDGLRSAVTHVVRARLPRLAPRNNFEWRNTADGMVDAILALPALRDVLAAAARDAEKVRRVEAEVEWLLAEQSDGDNGGFSDGLAAGQVHAGERIRRALDPS